MLFYLIGDKWLQSKVWKTLKKWVKNYGRNVLFIPLLFAYND